MAMKARPSRQSPQKNFAGVDGFHPRRSSAGQSQAKTGAKTRIARGFTDWYHDAGKPSAPKRPPRLRSVLCLAKTLSEDPACSKAVQKKPLPTKQRIRITAMRCHTTLRGGSAAP